VVAHRFLGPRTLTVALDEHTLNPHGGSDRFPWFKADAATRA
jgi:hypothetical protein